jgi:hypothetical protein
LRSRNKAGRQHLRRAFRRTQKVQYDVGRDLVLPNQRHCMAFPIKTCVVCGEEFELRPGKPGYANRCPDCSEPEESDKDKSGAQTFESQSEANEARRNAMRDLLYRKDS